MGGFYKTDNDLPRKLIREVGCPAWCLYDLLRSRLGHDNADRCWPSETILAAELGATPRTVRRLLAKLETHGLIKRARTGRQNSNVYTISEDTHVPTLALSEDTSDPTFDASEDTHVPTLALSEDTSDPTFDASEDTHVRIVRTPVSGKCGHPCPPKKTHRRRRIEEDSLSPSDSSSPSDSLNPSDSVELPLSIESPTIKSQRRLIGGATGDVEFTSEVVKCSSPEQPSGNGKHPRPRFTPPTLDEAVAYGETIGMHRVEVEAMHDYYTSKGWRVGQSAMKDWRAATRNWHRRSGQYAGSHHETREERMKRIVAKVFSGER